MAFKKTRQKNRHKRSKKNNTKQKSSTEKQLPSNSIPQQLQSGIVLLTEDEFYPVFLDLLLFNLSATAAVKVQSKTEFKKFKTSVEQGQYGDNIYLLDEMFGYPDLQLDRLLDFVKEHDTQATLVGLTEVADADIMYAEKFDRIAVKAKRDPHKDIAPMLAELLGKDLVFDNSDPEYLNQDNS